MKKLKKSLLFLLATSMIMSNTLTSLADNSFEGNVNSGGGTGVGSDSVYTHKFMAYPENQGYRISIVDTFGDRVANSVDIVNYIPSDIYGISYNNSNNGGGRQEFIDGFNQYKSWLGWSDYTGKGKTKESEFYYSNGIKTEEFSEKTWSKNGVPNSVNKDGETIVTRMYPKEDFEAYLEVNVNETIDRWNSKGIGGGKIPYMPEGIMKIPLPSVLNDSKTGFTPGGVELIEIMQNVIDKFIVGNSGENTNEENEISVESVATIMLNTMGSLYDNQGNDLGEVGYIFQFTDPTEQSRVGTKEVKPDTGEEYIVKPVDIVAEKGYSMIMEPIFWYVPELITLSPELLAKNNQNPHYANITGVCYGTVSYLDKYAYDVGKRDLGLTEEQSKLSYTGPDWGGSDLGVSTMMAAYTDTNLGVYEPSAAPIPLRRIGEQYSEFSSNQNYSLYNLAYGNNVKEVGYSVHIYDADYFRNDIGIPTSSSTHTWDSINYPSGSYTPGPAPSVKKDDGTFTINDSDEYGDKKNKFSVVKFYAEREDNGEYTYIENHTRTETLHNILIENEPDGYNVDSWFTNPTFKEPTSPTDSFDDYKDLLTKGTYEGNSAASLCVKATDPDTTLYMRLSKDKEPEPEIPDTNNKVILHENELSHAFTLEDINELITITHNFSDHYRSGRGTHDEDDDDHWRCSWHRYLTKDDYVYEVKNTVDYNNTTFIGSQGIFASVETGTVIDEGTANIEGTTTSGITPNLKFVVYRDKKDNVTLYAGKNSSEVINELSQIGITNQSYQAGNKRINTKGNGSWTSQFDLNYQYIREDGTLHYDSTCDEHGGSGSYKGTPSLSLDSLNNAFKTQILTKYELGQENSGVEAPGTRVENLALFGKSYLRQKWSTVKKGEDITFYPYIFMIYEGIDEVEKEAKVVSENVSKLGNIQIVDTGVYLGSNNPTLSLESEQWSTHSRAINGLRENGINAKDLNKSLLPGGATYDLKTSGNSDAPEAWVGIRSYQVTIPDENIEKLTGIDGVVSTSKGKELFNSFINQVKNNLEHYQITQWVSTGIYTNENDFKNGGRKLVSGQGAVSSFEGKSLSKDSKYYLKIDGEGASRADIDIINENFEQHIWRIQNNNLGEFWITKDGVEVARAKINSSRNIDSLLVNDEIKNLENRTKIISNYVKALDIELGMDRDGAVWYTEAFDGIEVIESCYAVQLGFGNNTLIRSSVLDPMLTGTLENKSDILNFDKDTLKEKTRTMQFRTSYKSSLSEAQSKPNGWIGDLNGEPVIINGIDNVLKSRLFYTGNSTVMDLN